MPIRFERQEFEDIHDDPDIRSYSDIEIVKCKIHAGGFGWPHSPDYSRRTTAERISIIDCEVRRFGIGPALCRDILIQNLKSDVLIVYSALFEHVTIKGRCGRLMIHGEFQPDPNASMPPGYSQLSTLFYSSVDWAIDIRQAEFEDFSFRTGGVPARLVRRDPETQVVVKRERLMKGSWRKLGLDGYTKVCIEIFIEEQGADTVLVVPKRMKGSKKLVDDLRKLQAAGIAEPE
jgi:hypothetical protein